MLALPPVFGGWWATRICGVSYLLTCVNSSIRKVETQRNSKIYSSNTQMVLHGSYVVVIHDGKHVASQHYQIFMFGALEHVVLAKKSA